MKNQSVTHLVNEYLPRNFSPKAYISLYSGVSASNKVVTVEARLTASLYYCLCTGACIMAPVYEFIEKYGGLGPGWKILSLIL